jgi:hypothetical protein
MPVLSQNLSQILSEGVLQYRPFCPQAFGKQLSRSDGLETPRQQIITARPKSFVKTDFFIEPVSLAGCDLYLLAVSPILYPGAITKFPMCFFARNSSGASLMSLVENSLSSKGRTPSSYNSQSRFYYQFVYGFIPLWRRINNLLPLFYYFHLIEKYSRS